MDPGDRKRGVKSGSRETSWEAVAPGYPGDNCVLDEDNRRKGYLGTETTELAAGGSVGDERMVSGYMGAFNENGEAWGRSRYHVGVGVWTKSCVLAELYL